MPLYDKSTPCLHSAAVSTMVPSASIRASAKNSCGCGAQCIQVSLVLAAQLQIFQASSAAQRVVRQVEHVVRFVIRQVKLEQVQPLVDRCSQSQLTHQLMDQADAAVRRAHAPPGQLVVNVAAPQHGLREVRGVVELVQSSCQAPLASRQALLDNRVHSKSLREEAGPGYSIPMNPRQSPQGFEFFCPPQKTRAGATLV